MTPAAAEVAAAVVAVAVAAAVIAVDFIIGVTVLIYHIPRNRFGNKLYYS